MVIGEACADFTFGEPTVVLSDAVDASISADGLEMYFMTIHPDGYGAQDIWVMRRATKNGEWGPAVNLGPPVNTSACDSAPSISADGLELYFCDSGPGGNPYRPGGYGGGDIWVAKRRSKDENWGIPVNLGPMVNTSSMEAYPNISADGLSLYFSNGDILVTTRATKNDDWGTLVNIGTPPNSPGWEGFPNISSDGRVLFFYLDQSGGYGGKDIYMTMRATVFDSWGPPQILGPMINTPYNDVSPNISADGSTLYFAHNNVTGWGGTWVIYETVISPIVDLNGDGIVDSTDMCRIVDHWGEYYPLCDIGPTPLGDGIVDVEDLIVLAKHLFEVYQSAETVEVNEDNDGGQIELELGKLLVVTLESNPSTGYRWELTENNESILKQFGQAEFKSSETSDPPPGTGGWEIFRFKAVSAGQMTLELVYHRSWEDVEPLKTFSIQVVVP